MPNYKSFRKDKIWFNLSETQILNGQVMCGGHVERNNSVYDERKVIRKKPARKLE